MIALDDGKFWRGPFLCRHELFRARFSGFSRDLREPTGRTLPLKGCPGRSVKEWDDVRIVIGNRVDIVDSVAVGIVHVGLGLVARRENPAAVLHVSRLVPVHVSRIGSRMDDLRKAFAGVGDSDSGASDEIHRARHALRDAIRRKRGCDLDEARRIAGILNRATADILSK